MNKYNLQPGDRVSFTNGYGYRITWYVSKVNGTTIEIGGDTRSLDNINKHLNAPGTVIERGLFTNLKHTQMKKETFSLEGVEITRKVLKRGKPKVSFNPAANLEGQRLKDWVGKYGVFATMLKHGTATDMALDLANIETDDLKTIIELCSGMYLNAAAYNRLTAEYMNRTLELKKPTV